MRLDRWLQRQPALAGIGRRHLAELLASGAVRLNGIRARKGTLVREGDVLTFTAAPPSPLPSTSGSALVELYVDDDLIAIDKPAGLPSTVGRTLGASVAAALLDRHPAMAAFGDRRHAGLVHRLDTGTSGLLLAARHAAAHARLRAAFAGKRVEKAYLAVVVGPLEEATVVTTPLARHPRSRRRMVTTRADHGWPARTEITPLAGDGTLTLVGLRMRTGVTHQLRVHLASIGHAVLGDDVYGAGTPTGLPLVDGHYLHARAIAFDEPDLPTGLITPFPAHWKPLFAARGWDPIP